MDGAASLEIHLTDYRTHRYDWRRLVVFYIKIHTF